MTNNRLADYLRHMRDAATDARGFVEGLGRTQFFEDKRTQQAVIMSLIVIGEAASQVMDKFGAFASEHPEVPWRNMRGMRNRMAHGYFDIDLETVWSTIDTELPKLINALDLVIHEA